MVKGSKKIQSTKPEKKAPKAANPPPPAELLALEQQSPLISRELIDIGIIFAVALVLRVALLAGLLAAGPANARFGSGFKALNQTP